MKVDSSAISELTWRHNSVIVSFKSGHTYSYSGISYSLYRRFLRAESKGKFFWRFIRDRYDFTRLS